MFIYHLQPLLIHEAGDIGEDDSADIPDLWIIHIDSIGWVHNGNKHHNNIGCSRHRVVCCFPYNRNRYIHRE